MELWRLLKKEKSVYQDVRLLLKLLVDGLRKEKVVEWQFR